MKFKSPLRLLRAGLPLLAIAISLTASPAQQTAVQKYSQRTGLGLTEANRYQSFAVNQTPLTRTLPPSIDLSGDMPPVGYQGQQESCVAWSTTYAVRSYLEKSETQQWNVRSPAGEFSPAFLYNQLARGNCSATITIPDALNLLSAQGAATMSMMPYNVNDCQTQPTQQTMQLASQYRIGGFNRVIPQNLNDMKSILAAKLPIVVALNVDNAFMTLGRNQVWKSSGVKVGAHAAVLVGYNDSQNAFKLINSWGTNWGTDGYGYIDYNLLPLVSPEAYVINPFHTHDQPSQPTQPNQPNQPTQPSQSREANVQILRLDIAQGGAPGLNAQLEYTLRGYAGHTGLIVLYFWYTNGAPVGAAIQGLNDVNGNAAIATQRFSIQQNDYTNYVFTQFIPTANLNVPMGQNVMVNGQVMYQPLITQLLVRADIFVDNYGLGKSQYFTFSVSR